MSTEPVTHLEQVVAGTTTPVTHLEQVVAGTATPVTHLEHVISENSGGGSATLIEKTVTQNGVYNAADDSADGYSKVTTDVPNSYAAGDEGKVVSNGALVAQSSGTATQNGTVDTTLINSLTVDVQGSGGDSGSLQYGNVSMTWATVTAGANNVTKVPDFMQYIKTLANVPEATSVFAFSAVDNSDRYNNMIVASVNNNSGSVYRYRNGSCSSVPSNGAAYDAQLNEGSKYFVVWGELGELS